MAGRANHIGQFFRELVHEYKQLGRDALEYKVHLFNSLIFFAARCTDDEIVLLYQIGSTFERAIIRAAVVLRRSLAPRAELRDDPVMMAVAVLDKRHYEKILHLLLTGESAFFSAVPFNYGAKLFPEDFLDFIEYLTQYIVEHNVKLDVNRRYSTLLTNSLLIYLLRNGPEQLFTRPGFRDPWRIVRERTSAGFFGARICESLEENSRYLFHYHPTDKASDLLHLEWYWRNLLVQALQGSGFELRISDVVGLLHLNAAVRLLLRYVFCRDMYDPRMPSFIDALFRTADIVAQDFGLGVLGWAGKCDPAFIPLSEDFVALMRTQTYQNFFRETLGVEDGIHSQYDPLVPHVTTLMLRNMPIDLSRLIPERHEQAGYRVGRLAQKTILDFPDETLALLYQYLESGETHPEIHIALRAAARFSPVSFWKKARESEPDDLFDDEGEEIVEITRIVAQVRDFDWYKIMLWATASPARKAAITRALISLLHAENLDTFFQSLAEMSPAPGTSGDE